MKHFHISYFESTIFDCIRIVLKCLNLDLWNSKIYEHFKNEKMK